MAGYALNKAAASRLTQAVRPLQYIKPDDLPLLPGGVSLSIIEGAVVDHMAAKKPDLKGVVAVMYAEMEEIHEIIIVTKGCLLTKPRHLKGPLPVATEGEWENGIREWLESNGKISLSKYLLCAAFSCVHENEYSWEVQDDYTDQIYF